MKFKVGDMVLITGGKDKGKKGSISRVFHKELKVVVPGINLYTKHVKPMNGKSGEKVRRERAIPLSKVAILNGEGKIDRIGYKINKDGSKVRVFRKTGKEVPEPKRAGSDKK